LGANVHHALKPKQFIAIQKETNIDLRKLGIEIKIQRSKTTKDRKITRLIHISWLRNRSGDMHMT
jgi:hypothetical protein